MPNDNGRPKVGPADPETRRRMLRETLDAEREDRAKERDAEAHTDAEIARAKRKKKSSSTLGDLLDPTKERERRVSGEDESLSEAVDRGVKMGTEPEKKRK